MCNKTTQKQLKRTPTRNTWTVSRYWQHANIDLKITGSTVKLFMCSTMGHLPSLVQINTKQHIISEHCNSVRCWHSDDKCKHIINESVECLRNIMNLGWLSIWEYQLQILYLSHYDTHPRITLIFFHNQNSLPNWLPGYDNYVNICFPNNFITWLKDHFIAWLIRPFLYTGEPLFLKKNLIFRIIASKETRMAAHRNRYSTGQ